MNDVVVQSTQFSSTPMGPQWNTGPKIHLTTFQEQNFKCSPDDEVVQDFLVGRLDESSSKAVFRRLVTLSAAGQGDAGKMIQHYLFNYEWDPQKLRFLADYLSTRIQSALTNSANGHDVCDIELALARDISSRKDQIPQNDPSLKHKIQYMSFHIKTLEKNGNYSQRLRTIDCSSSGIQKSLRQLAAGSKLAPNTTKVSDRQLPPPLLSQTVQVSPTVVDVTDPVVKHEKIKLIKQEGVVSPDLSQFIKDGGEVWDILPGVLNNMMDGDAALRRAYMERIDELMRDPDEQIRSFGSGLYRELPECVFIEINKDEIEEWQLQQAIQASLIKEEPLPQSWQENKIVQNDGVIQQIDIDEDDDEIVLKDMPTLGDGVVPSDDNKTEEEVVDKKQGFQENLNVKSESLVKEDSSTNDIQQVPIEKTYPRAQVWAADLEATLLTTEIFELRQGVFRDLIHNAFRGNEDLPEDERAQFSAEARKILDGVIAGSEGPFRNEIERMVSRDLMAALRQTCFDLLQEDLLAKSQKNPTRSQGTLYELDTIPSFVLEHSMVYVRDNVDLDYYLREMQYSLTVIEMEHIRSTYSSLEIRNWQ